MEKKNHYFCDACGCLSDNPCNCTTADCLKKGQSLEKCSCEKPDGHKKDNTNEGCSSCSCCSGCCS